MKPALIVLQSKIQYILTSLLTNNLAGGATAAGVAVAAAQATHTVCLIRWWEPERVD